jgi:HK97 family phage portal protein
MTTMDEGNMASMLSRMWKRGVNAPTQVQQKHSVPSWYGQMQSYVYQAGQPVWTGRNYKRFAEEGYRKNVIAHRAISMIADGAASVPLVLREQVGGALESRLVSTTHPLWKLINQPSPLLHGKGFFEQLYSYRLIAGNAYILAVSPQGQAPLELHLLRPDRVSVLAGKGGVPAAYRYQVGEDITDYPVDRVSGLSRVLHIKDFHPTDDWYGLSPVEAAAYSIDQHNQSSAWNQALLQNGARPSGALVVKAVDGNASGHLSEEQYYRIKAQVDEQFSGVENAGRPLLLEGGMEWREMSLSPKDMDFMEARHSSARDIALAFGVPPQLLGIPGDNTYSNLAEARLALWEQTILPLVEHTLCALNGWLCPMFDAKLEFSADTDGISALSPRRDSIWSRVKDADFLSAEEKRAMVGV